MAMFNEILAGRYNKALNAVFGIKAGAPAPSLGGDLVPGYAIDERAEERYLYGWNRWACSVSLTGGAAAAAYLTLRNKPNSNVIAVIERIRWVLQNDAAAQTFQIGKNNSGFAGGDLAAVLCQLDPRQNSPGSQTSALDVQTNITQAGLPAIQFVEVTVVGANSGTFVQDIIFTHNQEIALVSRSDPNTGSDQLLIGVATVNKQCGITVWWRERVREDSELR